jgi:hypothetical protein
VHEEDNFKVGENPLGRVRPHNGKGAAEGSVCAPLLSFIDKSSKDGFAAFQK